MDFTSEFQIGDQVIIYFWDGSQSEGTIEGFNTTLSYDVRDKNGYILTGVESIRLELLKPKEKAKCDMGCHAVNATRHSPLCSAYVKDLQ